MTTYRIRALEWKKVSTGYECIAPFCYFWVYCDDDDTPKHYWHYCVKEYFDSDTEECESLEDGMRKAEVYYAERIKQALEVCDG
jgi:hypothetical protein